MKPSGSQRIKPIVQKKNSNRFGFKLTIKTPKMLFLKKRNCSDFSEMVSQIW
jgi:hypothetical protein